MAKCKLKLSIIDDYLQLVKLQAFFDSAEKHASQGLRPLASSASTLNLKIKAMCKQIIFRLGLMDMAFALLEVQTAQALRLLEGVKPSNIDAKSLKDKLIQLKEVQTNLKQKIKLLNFSPVERGYLNSF